MDRISDMTPADVRGDCWWCGEPAAGMMLSEVPVPGAGVQYAHLRCAEQYDITFRLAQARARRRRDADDRKARRRADAAEAKSRARVRAKLIRREQAAEAKQRARARQQADAAEAKARARSRQRIAREIRNGKIG